MSDIGWTILQAGVPTLAIVVGIVINCAQIAALKRHIGKQIDEIEARLQSIPAGSQWIQDRLDDINKRSRRRE